MTAALPPRQRQVLNFITSHIQGKGYAPSVREIGRHFGMKSTNAVDDVLGALEAKGFVRRAPFKARGIQVLQSDSDQAAVSYSEVVEDMMQRRISALDDEITGMHRELFSITETLRDIRMHLGDPGHDRAGILDALIGRLDRQADERLARTKS
jgi:SOS-response transcriptional repressor LexA